MGMADLLTNPALWGTLGQFGQSLAARDPTSLGYTMGGYAKNLAQTEAYRQALAKQKKAEEEKKKAEGMGGLGKIAGSIGGFLLGGPAGAAAGATLGDYAGQRLGGSDSNDTPLLPTVMKAGIGYGTAKASDYLGGKLAETTASPQVAPTAIPAPSPVVAATDLAAPGPATEVPLDAPIAAPAVTPVAPVASAAPAATPTATPVDPTQLTKNDWNKLFQHPDYHTRLAAALAYSLNTPNPGPIQGASNALNGGGSSSIPPLQTGSFGMAPELVNQLNELSLARWKAGQQATMGQQELGLKGRQVTAEEARVGNETIRAASEYNRTVAQLRRAGGFDGVTKGVVDPATGEAATMFYSKADPTKRMFVKDAPKEGSAKHIISTMSDAAYGTPSPDGYWKVDLNTETGEIAGIPTVGPAAKNPPQGPGPHYFTAVNNSDGSAAEMVIPSPGAPAVPVTGPDGKPIIHTGAKPEKTSPGKFGETITLENGQYVSNQRPDPVLLGNAFVKSVTQPDGTVKAAKPEDLKTFTDRRAAGWTAEEKLAFARDMVAAGAIAMPWTPETSGLFDTGVKQKPESVFKFEDGPKAPGPVVGPYGDNTVDPTGAPVVWDRFEPNPKTGKLGAYKRKP